MNDTEEPANRPRSNTALAIIGPATGMSVPAMDGRDRVGSWTTRQAVNAIPCFRMSEIPCGSTRWATQVDTI